MTAYTNKTLAKMIDESQKHISRLEEKISLLDSRVMWLEDNNTQSKRIIELDAQVYELQQMNYKLQSQMRHMEIKRFIEEHYG